MQTKLRAIVNRSCLMFSALLLLSSVQLLAQIQLDKEIKVSDEVLFFDGIKVPVTTTTNSTTGYDYVYGNALTPHGDCVTSYKNFVFMTWYKGGKTNRHVMLSRYNTTTGVLKTIEFPHQHTGLNGNWWIGETHNTIAVGICPKNETIHMLYDMHRNGNVAAFANDYLRYSYTETGAATVPDDQFTIARFVNSAAGNYKHLEFDGITDINTTKLLTYPAFFVNDEGDLFMKNRFGYDKNGKFIFAKYDGNKWTGYTDFNRSNANSFDSAYSWGLYGDIKYLNGKIRVGFQQRANIRDDKYEAQNGIYYAYSDDPTGLTQWKDFKGTGFARPLSNSDLIKIAEPGDWVATTKVDKVYIVSGFDYTITQNEDVHFVSQVKDNEFNVTKKLHTYKKASDANFTTVEYNAGSELYASGNDVYVIGLVGGRVNIAKTAGGTSNFKQVYQHTTGPTFDKGIAYVNNGKLYYYLKQAGGTGDKRTTYLQVFDLALTPSVPVDPAREVNFSNIVTGEIISKGTNLIIEANVGTDIKEVSLWNGTTNLGTLTNAPYSWSSHPILTNMNEPSYTFKLIGKDAANVEVEKSITITTPNQWAYTLDGKPHTLPGKVQFEHYDNGGINIAYWDKINQNVSNFRKDQMVSISTDGNIVKDIKSGEWLEFTINVEESGDYDLNVTHQTRRTPAFKQLTVSLPDEGSTLLSDIILTNTGSGAYLNEKIGTIYLEKGEHVLRFGLLDFGFDLDSFELVYKEDLSVSKFSKESMRYMKIYPNPTSSTFEIVIDDTTVSSVSIFDSTGKIVHNGDLSSLKSIQLPKGVYVVKAIGENKKIYHQKLVIN